MNNPNRPRSNMYSEDWIRESAEAETEAGCNIHAGLELGKNLGKFLDFLMREVKDNPSCLIPYTKERDREIELLLNGVVLDEEEVND